MSTKIGHAPGALVASAPAAAQGAPAASKPSEAPPPAFEPAAVPASPGGLEVPAREMKMVGKHAISGTLNGIKYTGALEIQPDGRYEIKRAYESGDQGLEQGTVGFAGSTITLSSSAGTTRAFSRKDTKTNLELTDGAERWHRPERHESRVDEKVYTLGLGVGHYLLNDNFGTVEGSGATALMRSKQPTVEDLERLPALKTVVSFNGDSPAALSRYMSSKPVEHAKFHLSAGRVPNDQELVGIFKVLLDESKRPLLMHCQGGSDRTGIISALYQIEFQGMPKQQAMNELRKHLWISSEKTWIQGAYLQLYKKGTLTKLLIENGVAIPPRYADAVAAPAR